MEGTSPAQGSQRGGRRLPLLIAGAALVVVAVVVLLVTSGGASSGITSISVDSPAGIAAGAGATWVTSHDRGEVVRIGASGETEASPAGPRPTAIIARQNAIWVATEDGRQLTQLSPLSREVTRKIEYIPGCECSASQFGFRWDALWASSGDQRVVKMFDYLAGSRLGYGYHPGPGFRGPMVLLEHVLWAVENDEAKKPPVSEVIHIDLNEGAIRHIPIRKGSDFTQLTYGNGLVWISDAARGTVAAYDPKKEAIVADVPVSTAEQGDLLAANDEFVLAWDPESGELSQIDAKTMKVSGTKELPDYEPGRADALDPDDLVLDGKTAWIADRSGDTVYEVEY